MEATNEENTQNSENIENEEFPKEMSSETKEWKQKYKDKLKELENLGVFGYDFAIADKICQKEFYEGAVNHIDIIIAEIKKVLKENSENSEKLETEEV